MNSVVPNGWDSKRLGDVASLIMGQSPTSDTYNDEKNGTPFFQGKADFGVKYPKVRYWCTSPTKIAPIDSILFSVRAPVGAVNLNNIEACIGRGLASISGKSIDNTFLYQSLIHAKVKFEALGQGSTFEAINGNELKEFSLVCPPLPEQKKIASILTSVDEVIENTQKQIDKLQDLKKATMNELLTKGIGHTEFKDSELGRIPRSWEARQVQEIAKIIRGASPRPKGDPRYYGGTVPRLMGSDVTRDGKYVFPKTDFLTPEGAKLSRPMSKGGLTIVCSGTVGVPSILGVDACIHDGFLGLVDISNQCTTEFLYYAFLPLQGKFDSSATHGGVFTNLTTEILKEFIVGIPPLGEQREIVRHISSLDGHLNAQINKLSQTQSLKKSLMQDLLTGKVRVSVN